jgi:hypothetical protein
MSNRCLHSVTLESQQMARQSHQSQRLRPLAASLLATHPPMCHALYHKRAKRAVSSRPVYKVSTAPDVPHSKKKRGEAERFSAPLWGVDNPQGIPHRLQKFMLFFREVDHNKGVTRWATKVSLH